MACSMQSPDTVIEAFHASRVVDPIGFDDYPTYPTQAITDYMDVIQNYILYIQFLTKTTQTTKLQEIRKDLDKLQVEMRKRSIFFTETEKAALAPRAGLLFY